MASSEIKSHAKINLSLGVIKKIDSEYHKIESLISFLKCINNPCTGQEAH